MKNRTAEIFVFFTLLFTCFIFSGCRETAEMSQESSESRHLEGIPVESGLNTAQEEHIYYINDVLFTKDISGAILVAQGEDFLFHESNGFYDIDNNIENEKNSPFLLASITKQFTGAAILLLEEEGLLSAQDTIDTYFPGYSGLEKVTIQDLLSMEAGFGDYLDYIHKLAIEGELEKINALTCQDIENYIISNWIGEKRMDYKYSNSDYYLLGRIIEKVSGKSYEEYVTEMIFIPAGMLNSGFFGSHETAMPHYDFGDMYFEEKMMSFPFSVLHSIGGIISTTDDLSSWLDIYFGGGLFSESALERVAVGHYNYGWHIRDDSIWWHDGVLPGFRTCIVYDRNTDMKIIQLYNNKPSVSRDAIRQINNKLLSVTIP